jgi:hypothetical protein
MAIRIVSKLSKPAKICCGCGASTHSDNFYEGDTVSAWCDDCFVNEDKLKEIQSRMPFCAPPTKPKKIRCIVVPFLSVPFD